jgi:hypothetical protein
MKFNIFFLVWVYFIIKTRSLLPAVTLECCNSAFGGFESRLATLACYKIDTAEVLTSDRHGSDTPPGSA